MFVLDKKYAKKIQPKNRANERVEVIEMDELYSFVERKKRIYVITLVSRDKCQILGYDIAFDRSRERIQKLVDNSVKASKYYSDFRHYIPALHRRSKCFFRSIETMNAVFKIFVHAFNKFALAKFLYPSLKSAFTLSRFI